MAATMLQTASDNEHINDAPWRLHSLLEQLDNAVLTALSVVLESEEVKEAIDMLPEDERVKLITSLLTLEMDRCDKDLAVFLSQQEGFSVTAVAR